MEFIGCGGVVIAGAVEGPESEGLAHHLRQGADGRYRWHWGPAFMEGGGASSSMATERLENASRNLRLPVQLVRGQNSELVTREAVEAFLLFVPSARLDDIAGAGRMVVGDRNDAFSSAIAHFLRATQVGHSSARRSDSKANLARTGESS